MKSGSCECKSRILCLVGLGSARMPFLRTVTYEVCFLGQQDPSYFQAILSLFSSSPDRISSRDVRLKVPFRPWSSARKHR